VRVHLLPLVALALAASVLAAPAGASDGVDLGGTSLTTATASAVCPGSNIFVPPASTAGSSYVTTAGVITWWSVTAGSSETSTLALKVVRAGPDSSYTVTGTSATRQLTAYRLNTFLTRVPVVPGDRIATYVAPSPGSAGCVAPSIYDSDTVQYSYGTVGDLPVGERFSVGQTLSKVRLNLSAHVEPDVDGDGWGDLTQDACPALPNSHTDCAPPDTVLTTPVPRKVIAKGRSVTLKLRFVSGEPATFACSVDGAAPSPCPGSLKVRLKPGKHSVRITATDTVGNVDPTPAVVDVKVRRR
jgi:hypothetical protein